MKYKVLRNCKFRAGNPKKLYDVIKGEMVDINSIDKLSIGDIVELVKEKSEVK